MQQHLRLKRGPRQPRTRVPSSAPDGKTEPRSASLALKEQGTNLHLDPLLTLKQDLVGLVDRSLLSTTREARDRFGDMRSLHDQLITALVDDGGHESEGLAHVDVEDPTTATESQGRSAGLSSAPSVTLAHLSSGGKSMLGLKGVGEIDWGG
jgi:hypothetical protein